METLAEARNVQIDSSRKQAIDKLSSTLVSRWKFRFYLIWKMPIAWIAGMRLLELTTQKCVTSIPFKWLSQNPFRSTYFATQSMAAELSTGALAIIAVRTAKVHVSMLIVDMDAEFVKKGTETVYFTCNEGHKIFEAVDETLRTGEGSTVKVISEGKTKSGMTVSRFSFTWSFKAK